MYVGIAAVAVLVVLGLVAVLVVPKLLGNDDPVATAPSPSTGLPTTGQSAPTTAPSGQPSPAPRLAEARALTVKFLNYLNANDQKHAAALGCAETVKLLPTVILLAIDPPTKLTVSGPATAMRNTTTQAYYQDQLSVPFSGTTKHNPATGTVRVMDEPPRPVCVRLMTLDLG